MKKNYNYFLFATVSVATLLVIAIVPIILNNDNSVTVKSEKSSNGHLIQKHDPRMDKKQSMMKKPDPRMDKKQSMMRKLGMNMNKKSQKIKKIDN